MMFWNPDVAPFNWFSRVLLKFMFPQTRLLFQPPPTEMLSMLPALPIVTALPPPMLYSTSSPMTLPEDDALIGSAAKAAAQARLQTSPIAQGVSFMSCSDREFIGSPCCRERSAHAAHSRSTGARVPRHTR